MGIVSYKRHFTIIKILLTCSRKFIIKTANNTGIISDAPDIRPDNPAFFISDIRPDTGFDLPDIQPDTGS
jgi:hypothetical protein